MPFSCYTRRNRKTKETFSEFSSPTMSAVMGGGTTPAYLATLLHSRRPGHNRDPIAIRQGDGLLLIDHDGLVRLDGQHTRPRFAHRLDRRAADRRHIEAHVLPRLGDLHDDDAAARTKLARAQDRPVGPFDRFD